MNNLVTVASITFGIGFAFGLGVNAYLIPCDPPLTEEERRLF
jgi:hypothetical protein